MARTRSSEEGCRIRWRKSWKDVDLDDDVDPSITTNKYYKNWVWTECNVVAEEREQEKKQSSEVFQRWDQRMLCCGTPRVILNNQ